MTNMTQRTTRLRLWNQRPVCAYCRRNLRRRTATVDHLVPRSAGGTDDDSNLVLACATCNLAKDNRTPIEWCADILQAAVAAGVLA